MVDEPVAKSDTESIAGLLPGAWSIGMLYYIIFGVPWNSCAVPVYALLALPGFLPFFALVGVAIYTVYCLWKGKPENVSLTIRETWCYFSRFVVRQYRCAPKTWTVAGVLFVAFMWTMFGRYSTHEYTRGGTVFMRVEDHLTGSVTYRPEVECPRDDDRE